MGKNAWGSKAMSAGYSHKGPVAGAGEVMTGGTRSDTQNYGSARKKNPDIGVNGMTKGPKSVKTYKEGAGVKV